MTALYLVIFISFAIGIAKWFASMEQDEKSRRKKLIAELPSFEEDEDADGERV